jgi:bacterioferritin-associated ferredoxin
MDAPLFCSTNRPLCHCLNVDADEVRAAIDDGGLQTVRQVSQACGAGGGCTSCHRHIKRMLAEAAADRQHERQTEPAREPAFGFA